MSNVLSLVVGSYALVAMTLFVWGMLVMILVTRALLVVPRELAAIRRALEASGAAAGHARAPHASEELEAYPARGIYTSTGPLGRI